jgi:hypothetical protein
VLEGENCREEAKPKSKVFDLDVAEKVARNRNDDRGKIWRTQRANVWSVKKRGIPCYSGWIV